MKELGFARKSESFLQIPRKLIIKQHIFKAFFSKLMSLLPHSLIAHWYLAN